MKTVFRLAAFAAVGLSIAGLASAVSYSKQDRATLRALDKITGRSTDIVVKLGQPVVFGSLNIELQACFQSPPEEVPESAAFLRVSSTQPVSEEQLEGAEDASTETAQPLIFSGWMYASSPGLSALEHPVYDIWVIRCTAPAPVKLPDRVTIPLGEEPLTDDVPATLSGTDEPPVIEEVVPEPEPID